MSPVYYFGCWQHPGHFLRDHYGHPVRDLPRDFPVSPNSLDSRFLPPFGDKTEGLSTYANINGWTIIAFWDNSIDERPGANSAFLMRGEHGFDDAVKFAKQVFPKIWERFTFPVVQRKAA